MLRLASCVTTKCKYVLSKIPDLLIFFTQSSTLQESPTALKVQVCFQSSFFIVLSYFWLMPVCLCCFCMTLISERPWSQRYAHGVACFAATLIITAGWTYGSLENETHSSLLGTHNIIERITCPWQCTVRSFMWIPAACTSYPQRQ